MKTSDVLAQAIELIEKHGWVRWRLGDCKAGYCILGAIREAMGAEIFKEENFALSAEEETHVSQIVKFNDYRCEGKEHALIALAQMSVRALAQGL